MSLETSAIETSVLQTPGAEPSVEILEIIFDYALNKFSDTKQRLEAGRPKFLSVIERFIAAGTRVEMCLPAFPFKSANKIYKVLGVLPDKAEEIGLERLNKMCLRIGEIYTPGARCTIISDGLVYNDLLSISDRDTWAYGQALRAMAVQKGFNNISFSRIRDLVDFPLPEKMEEITYVANATNFRRFLFNHFGKDDIDIDHEIATNPDTKMTYLGYRRFLESDLENIFPLGNGRSSHGYKRNVKYLAKQMLIRGYAFSGAVQHAFPNHLRLSIHQSTGEHKISMSLLNTKTGFTTPWHCSVALMADGEWVSAPMGEFQKDPKMKIVYEDSRPCYFQETTGDVSSDQNSANQPAAVSEGANQDLPRHQIEHSTTAPSSLVEVEVEKINAIETISAGDFTDENGEPVNPFFGSQNPLLDPNSANFSFMTWLQAVMSITSRDPGRYPKGVAGVAYRNLSAHGVGEATDYQKTFGNYPLKLFKFAKRLFSKEKQTRIQILRGFDGLVKSGEMLVVLGRPGSGCSTLLKTISGETDGFYVGKDAYLNYQGIPKETMHKDFRGECIYQAEVDAHFPQLTVGQTLDFAARARMYVTHLRNVVMAVGNDFVRGISGGERKRVSIAEAAIGGSSLQCWDNSTRGLDSATALQFVRTLRTSTQLTGATALVTVYQASQSIYDAIAVLYEGRQIYFGNIHAAKSFFVNLGFKCPPRQVTGDFLTSLTSSSERRVRPGFEVVWEQSEDRARLLQEIEEFDRKYPIGGPSFHEFKNSRRAVQARSQRIKSPYTLSVSQQVALCVRRGFQRLRGDIGIVITGAFFNAIMALVIGSIFYNLHNDTDALYSRGALLFFATLLASFASALEILTLYAQRPIVEKQSKYAFYHPFAEAIASMICDLPNKVLTALGFNLTLYFMTNLRRTPGHFFVFLLFAFTCTLTMSMYFRCIAALSRTLPEALAPASLFSLSLAIYTGFSIPIKDMHPWFRWLNYLNPFHDRRIDCSKFIPEGPGYGGVSPEARICATTGAAAGAYFVDGDMYLAVNFHYTASHLWRNLGIMIALMIFGCSVYLVATEYISAKKSKGEVLLFRRGRVPYLQPKMDEEANADDRINAEMLAQEKPVLDTPAGLQKQTAVFQWNDHVTDVNYDIKVNKKPQRLLDRVDGWVKPGTLTALMGVTGAGKTTLLDVLASRATIGVVSGEFLVNGQYRDTGFQRKTGYVQQQDLHLATTTVREALTFSALLRQPRTTPDAEKIAYVEEVIKVLEMGAYADAVVGVPGEGLNIEQRKRLTIGVELAAKPALLFFLDEPTSGLDSQTAWSICALLRKLADNGQAILCTIHQPSAHLFQVFDRLLLLTMGGKTLYFGEIGNSSKTVTSYFERNGARSCGQDENPAEWMLEVTGTAGGSESTQDWSAIWNNSEERKAVKTELARMKENFSQQPVLVNDPGDPDALRSFAAPFGTQFWIVLKRVFQQYWRTPSYLYSKVALCLFCGLQNQMYAIFMLLVIFTNVCSQIMPHYVTQRTLYEARESPSKTYSWKVFVLSNMLVEIPWNSLSAFLIFVSWYYPIGLRQNAVEANQGAEREALMFLFILAFLNFAGTFTSMVMAAVDSVEAGGNITNLLHSLSLIFCGVLVTPAALPGFWIFMYRVSPFTYFFSGVLSVGLANSHISCSTEEFLHFSPPSPLNCSTYLAPYIETFGGYLTSDSMGSTTECVFCSGSDTNVFLESVSAKYKDRWRNFGIFWVYILFNIAAAVGLFWLTRVPKEKREQSVNNERGEKEEKRGPTE
ncbi:Pyoverdine/dityrosine biosynthesis protein-domain-containing protein [Hyaloscypha sp. PMI_1271]|nr:Pyoverdine/dityrosine biosynthesis protein-domain-containing protein [Hyaloscypha sp. PMI_1271]